MCINVTEMGRRLGISRSNAYELVNRADFYPAFRIGKRVLISVEALTRRIAEQVVR